MRSTDHPWDEIFKSEGRFFPEPFPRFNEVVQIFRDHGCSEILDLGCGSGRHLIRLAQESFKVYGLDISPTGLHLTREWLSDEGLEADLVLADMRKPLPFREGNFTGVLSTQVIHHARIAGVRSAIQEIWRVLVSGGLAFVTVSGRRDEGEFEEIEPGTIVPLTGQEKGLPHHIFSEGKLREEFQDFDLLDFSLRAEGKVLAVLARKP
ncbi:MAG: class I SAM-dependent methyltransferase [Anaerolineaceae bacterium]|nr:MAG: class I SAM-dependent methyltransferase [Anaerolineaceae bacterium]